MTQIRCFFELIRISLGVRSTFSEEPSTQQWQSLFEIAQQQALIGICFNGVSSLVKQGVKVPRQLYCEWLAHAGLIIQQNEMLNRESTEISQRISDSGYRCCILKGQAVANLYVGELKTLRQPGDIDVWVIAQPKAVITLGRSLGRIYYYDYHHADLDCFPETEVEMHYRPTLSRNLWRNTRLQRWFKSEGEQLVVYNNQLGFYVARADFNLILTLNHNFWHLLYEGVGMRQMMDLYYVLWSHSDYYKNTDTRKLLKHFGLTRFASAAMWVMQEAFGLENAYFVCEPNEKSGRFLMDDIMTSGNFGHYDPRLRHDGRNRLLLMARWLKHSIRLFRYFPADVLWTPIGIMFISLWRRWHYAFDKQIHYDKR